MNEERTLLAGIDFCNDYTQLSCFNRKNMQPDSMSIGTEKSKYRIPTALVAKKSTREWLIGDDDAALSPKNEANEDLCIVDRLVDRVMDGSGVMVFDRVYTPESLLAKYFKRLLNVLRQRYFGEGLMGLVVTTDTCEPKLNDAIRRALLELGIDEDRLRIITHLESFMYYTVSQSTDIWVNDVGLFDYTSKGLCFYRLTFGRKQEPLVVAAEKMDLSDSLDLEMQKTELPERLAYIFDNLSGAILHKQIISAIFVTGAGFEGSWADEVLKGMCVGRRVFRGQNLYTKGACYASRMIFEEKRPGYLMLDDEMLRYTIAIRVYHDARYSDVVMASAGDHWQGAGGEVRVILDNTNEIDILVKNIMKRDPVCAILTLEPLEKVSDKTMQLCVSLRFIDRDTAVITSRDIGFGGFRRSSHRIWEQILKL